MKSWWGLRARQVGCALRTFFISGTGVEPRLPAVGRVLRAIEWTGISEMLDNGA
jgi:hypothetical protein